MKQWGLFSPLWRILTTVPGQWIRAAASHIRFIALYCIYYEAKVSLPYNPWLREHSAVLVL